MSRVRIRPTLLAAFAVALLATFAAPAAAQDDLPAWMAPEDTTSPPPYPRVDSVAVVGFVDEVLAYNRATYANDGAEAARWVTRASLDHYARLARLAVHATEAELRAGRPADLFMVLLLRHEAPPAMLRTLSGDSVLAFLVRRDIAPAPRTGSRKPVWGNDEVRVARAGGTDFYYRREDGRWKWDMMPLVEAGNVRFEKELLEIAQSDTPMTAEEYMFHMLHIFSDRPVPSTIWQPLR